MFHYAYGFDSDVSNWNVGSVTNMNAMFWLARECRFGDITRWDVSRVTNFAWMFANTKLNLDLSTWTMSQTAPGGGNTYVRISLAACSASPPACADV